MPFQKTRMAEAFLQVSAILSIFLTRKVKFHPSVEFNLAKKLPSKGGI